MNVSSAIKKHRALLAIGILLGLLGASASLAQPLVVGDMIEAVEADHSLVGPLVLAGLLFATDAGLAATHAYAIGRAGANIVFDLRRGITGRLLRADMAAFREFEQGDVAARLVADTSIARMGIAESLTQITTSGFMLVGGLVLMAWIDLWLLAVTLTCLGGASAISLGLAVQIRRTSVRNREDMGLFGSGLHRVLGAMTTVKACRAEERETETIGELAERARQSGVRVSALSALMTPAMNVGTQISLAAVIGVGMSRVATAGIAPADLTSFVMYLFYLVTPLVLLFVAIGRLQQSRAAISRVETLGSIRQEVSPSVAPAKVGSGVAVEFEGIGFSYNGDVSSVLKDLSFTVPDRGLTAIVGPSGAGKTTIFQLIERLYLPDEGTIRVAGIDTDHMPLWELRRLVGYVEQESTLMRGTIRDNLTYAQPDASESDIADAVRSANLEGLVSSLPRGLETDLGERGAGLSGGERQRLAVARTLLQDPRVVLLDEVTAHLDGDAEAALTQTMATVARHCAVIVIAHRLSTVAGADQIILLEDGRVRAMGTHESLLNEDMLYHRLATQQFTTPRRHECQVS